MGRRIRKSRAGLKLWKEMTACVRFLNLGFTNIAIYPPTHPEVREVVNRLHAQLQAVFTEHEDIGYGYMDQILYIEGAASIEETQNNETLVAAFEKLRLKYLTIDKAATQEDLLGFFTAINEEINKRTGKPLSELIHDKNVESLHVVESEAEDEGGKSKKGRKKTLLDWYIRVIDHLKPIHQNLRDAADADLRTLYRMADDMMATIRTKGYEPFLLLPYLSKGLDPHMSHNVNTAVLCGALAELYGLNSGQAQTLVVSALLHDLGRCIIPVEWADDPSPLTLFERAVVAQHPAWGFLLLTRNEEIPPHVCLLAAHHHEKPVAGSKENSYFPDILHKLLHIADAYDYAQLSDRHYWRQQPRHRMLRSILRRRKSWYGPTVAKLLAQVVGYYPLGTMVRLDDGRPGIVVRNNPANVGRPRLYMFKEKPPTPKPLKPGEVVTKKNAEPEEPPPVILDLMELTEGELGFKHSIAGVLSAPQGPDVSALIDRKKEYLLSHKL